MCTLSFMPVQGGFHLLMNRDEQRTRAEALSPEFQDCGAIRALYPSEPTGGTWIGSNERGMTLALINWYSKPQLGGTPALSRGAIIPKLLAKTSSSEAEALLRELPLTRLHPFRLIMVSARDESLHEFRSDSVTLEKLPIPWERNHWFSSGFEEAEAMRIRGKTVRTGQGTDTLTDLRNLHRSHLPEKGPFSICMHREDACTMSFTEVTLRDRVISMTYQGTSPCEVHTPASKLSLALTD
jgi:hypothetical protein